MPHPQILPMAQIIAAYRPPDGRNWFFHGHLTTYSTQMPPYGYGWPGHALFITRDGGPWYPPGFTLRHLDYTAQRLRIIGELVQFDTRAQAHRALWQYFENLTVEK